MPSFLHEGLIALIREKPAFTADLLRLLKMDVPDFREARLTEASFNELVPAEYHADAAVLLVEDAPVLGIIFEAQLRPDRRKRFTWPVYVVNGRARHECPFVLVVLTPDANTARWAAEPIQLGMGSCLIPLVFGPEGIPIITDPERASKNPELAMLSVMAHGNDDADIAQSVAFAASAALESMTPEKRMIYSRLIGSALGEAARKAFKTMHPATALLLERLDKERFERDRVEFVANGKAASVLTVLEARGLAVTSAQREQIENCTDHSQLDQWLRRAVTVTDSASLFA